jgi:hypothetical protein
MGEAMRFCVAWEWDVGSGFLAKCRTPVRKKKHWDVAVRMQGFITSIPPKGGFDREY